MCIKNFEECISRFPEHFKSIYRLVLIYLNAPERIKDAKKCEQLLLGTYTTAFSASQVQGLFTDRKNNNLFNVRKIGLFSYFLLNTSYRQTLFFFIFPGDLEKPIF